MINYFNDHEEENLIFFSDGGVFSQICKLASQLPGLVSKIPLLCGDQNACLRLNQLQISSLLANSFLCRFPAPLSGNFGNVNMEGIFAAHNVEKLKCVLNYFTRVTQGRYTPDGIVEFSRRSLKFLPVWSAIEHPVIPYKSFVSVSDKGKIEDVATDKYITSDFANRILGGGVLNHGLVQEEIRCLICPEMIVGRLFCEKLQDHEVIVIKGVERFCDYDGYGYDSFKFVSDHQDDTPFKDGMRMTEIVAFDALKFSNKNANTQFSSKNVLRELNKAYVAFFNENPKIDERSVCTGRWGSGVFNGDVHLKYVIQLMAASVAGRPMLYLTWEDEQLKHDTEQLNSLLLAMGFTVREVMQAVENYSKKRNNGKTIYEYLKEVSIT